MVMITCKFRTKLSNRELFETRRIASQDIDWAIRTRKQYGWDLVGFKYEWED